MAALQGRPTPALTGWLPHGGWAREICRDELWILLYVRTVAVTAPLVSDSHNVLGKTWHPRPRHRSDQSDQSAARQLGQVSAARLGLIWFGLIRKTCTPRAQAVVLLRSDRLGQGWHSLKFLCPPGQEPGERL